MLIIIIIIILIIAAIIIRKKRDEKFNALLGEEDRLPRLQPEIGPGLPRPAGTGPYTEPQLALPVPATHPYGAARAAAADVPQLPPRSDGVSQDEMVQLLELRLAKGEIDLETYKKLSRKYEGGPRYGVTPQQQKLLPPAPAATPVTQPQPTPQPKPSAPTPTVTAPQPTVTPQPKPTPTSTPQPTVKQPQVKPVSSTPTLTPTVKKTDEGK